MAKKRASETSISSIRKALETGKVAIGTKETMQAIRRGSISTVFLAANCPVAVAAEIEQRHGIAAFTMERLTQDSDEVGVLCKKSFAISVLGIVK